MRDTTRKIIMICTVMALLLVSGTNIFASHVAAVPTARRNGMMDRIREKIEDGMDDMENGGDHNTTDSGLGDNQNGGTNNGGTNNGSGTITDNNGGTNVPNSGTDSATGGADPLTSNDPVVTNPQTTNPETTTQNESDNVLEDENGKGFNWWGIIIAVAIAAAVVILIIALLPKK